MHRNQIHSILTVLLVASALTAAACEESAPSSSSAPEAQPQTVWKLDAMPEGGVDVAKAKTSVKEGDQITMIGRIGGRMEPIASSSGVFVIMDTAVPSCADMEEDHCPTPWDYCCEAPESITTNAATVQLRDAEGKPITLAENDLQPLDHVAVVGTVAPRPNDETLVVHATGVYVVADQ